MNNMIVKNIVSFAQRKDADKVHLIIIKYINVNKYNALNLAFSIKIISMKIKNVSTYVINHIMKFMNITFVVIKLINAIINVNNRESVKSVHILRLSKNGQLKMVPNFPIKFISKTPKEYNVNRR